MVSQQTGICFLLVKENEKNQKSSERLGLGLAVGGEEKGVIVE